jgi:hypothetical protein
VAPLLFAGAATAAMLALSSAASPGNAQVPVAAPSVVAGSIIAVDDDTSGAPGDTGGGINDQGQTSGDIFTQNAQDQSTA